MVVQPVPGVPFFINQHQCLRNGYRKMIRNIAHAQPSQLDADGATGFKGRLLRAKTGDRPTLACSSQTIDGQRENQGREKKYPAATRERWPRFPIANGRDAVATEALALISEATFSSVLTENCCSP